MQEAKRRIPHFTLVEEYDVTALEDTRAMMNRDRGSNPKLTLLPFLITAMARALAEWPMLNATYDDDANVITRHGAVHMGVATQTPNGLMVPVIRDAQGLGVWQLASEILRLAEAARSGKAAREELSGSTITISSLGPMGGVTSTPVINRPEVAILAVNKVEEKLVVVDGEIEVRKRMNLSLSCDHRVVDGWDAANFMQALKSLHREPAAAAERLAPADESLRLLARAANDLDGSGAGRRQFQFPQAGNSRSDNPLGRAAADCGCAGDRRVRPPLVRPMDVAQFLRGADFSDLLRIIRANAAPGSARQRVVA